jgi:hypothetical protein
LAEHLLCKERVRSSSLLVSTIAGCACTRPSIGPLIRVLEREATDQRTAGDPDDLRSPWPLGAAPYKLE